MNFLYRKHKIAKQNGHNELFNIREFYSDVLTSNTDNPIPEETIKRLFPLDN